MQSLSNSLFMIILICPITFEPLKMEGLCIKMVAVSKCLLDIFVQPLEFKLKVCTSNSSSFHFYFILVTYRAKIMKIVPVSKYIFDMSLSLCLNAWLPQINQCFLRKLDITCRTSGHLCKQMARNTLG